MTNTKPEAKSKKIILVVEDDTNVQSIYKDLLTKEGYDVILTNTVDRACDELGKGGVNLVLLDIMLPGGKNGYDFLEIAQKQKLIEGIPVIVLSNLDRDSNIGKEMGVVEWIVKANSSAQDVVNKVKSILK